jgi:hypothetical protein
MKIYETDDVVKYLHKRNILRHYLKSKKYFELGHLQMINFKLLKPKKNKIFQFRITNKYRARGYYKDDGFLVFDIADHQ